MVTVPCNIDQVDAVFMNKDQILFFIVIQRPPRPQKHQSAAASTHEDRHRTVEWWCDSQAFCLVFKKFQVTNSWTEI